LADIREDRVLLAEGNLLPPGMVARTAGEPLAPPLADADWLVVELGNRISALVEVGPETPMHSVRHYDIEGASCRDKEKESQLTLAKQMLRLIPVVMLHAR